MYTRTLFHTKIVLAKMNESKVWERCAKKIYGAKTKTPCTFNIVCDSNPDLAGILIKCIQTYRYTEIKTHRHTDT